MRFSLVFITQYIFILVLLGSSASIAQAQVMASLPSLTNPIDAAGSAKPIAAWVDFCDNYEKECAYDPTEPALVSLNAKVWKTIVATNRKVNLAVKPVTDNEHWGVVDRWNLPNDGLGDCEDYQLLKRKLLAEAGLPRRAMRMTVVVDDQKEGHAVLMIRTDRGDFILDNKTNNVLPWNQTGYIFVKREGQESKQWVSLGGLTSPVSTANR